MSAALCGKQSGTAQMKKRLCTFGYGGFCFTAAHSGKGFFMKPLVIVFDETKFRHDMKKIAGKALCKAEKAAHKAKKAVQNIARAGKSARKSDEKAKKESGAEGTAEKPLETAVSPFENIKEEIKTFRERDPAAKSDVEVLLLYSGLHAILAYRVAHKLYLSEHYFSARALSQFAKFITGIEIHPGAKIGRRFFIDHGAAVVIGETTEIGDDCTIYQGVTLGGTGKDIGKRHPTLGNGVMIGAGAKVLGPLKIGDKSKVAAGAVVLSEIPENCTAVGIPARVVRREGQRVDDLDQVHIPDPVASELRRIEERIAELEKKTEKEKSTEE